MHAKLVASMSKPLRALVTGGMDESRRGIVEWPEVKEATFVRFFQFAYTGQFDAEEPEQPPPMSPETPIEPEEPVAEAPFPEEPVAEPVEVPWFSEPAAPIWGSTTRAHKKATETKQTKLWSSFKDVYMPYCIHNEWPMPKQDPAFDFTPVFLAYAELYVMADEKDIKGLADLSLRRLHHTLTHFNLQVHRHNSIATLVEYCFDNTCDKGGEQDGLRRLVCLFSACKLEALWTSKAFQRVFAEIGDFSIGVVDMLLKRLD
ncbi:hypothetical protein PG984_015791 [Apiospora sp. TS-2023a]